MYASCIYVNMYNKILMFFCINNTTHSKNRLFLKAVMILLCITGDSSTALHDCPLGHYCPESTGHDPIPCPSGTYSDVTGLGAESECTVCDPGQYCQGQLST